MTTTTTALVLDEIGGPFRLETIRLGEIQPNEALVEIQATGVCHTDISCASGVLPSRAPAVFGHEGAGVIKAVGSDLKGFAPGDKVLLSFASCQTCQQCTEGHPAYCDSFDLHNYSGARPDGSSSMLKDESNGGKPLYSHFFGQSSFSNMSLVPACSLVKVPQDTDLALFAPLGCGIQTGAGCVLNALDVQEGATVAVFGAGSVGVSAIMAAHLRKARTIIAVDLLQSRLDLAKELGATHTLMGNDEGLLDKIREIAPPKGVEFAVECTGVPTVLQTMMQCLRSRGAGASLGAPTPGKTVTLDIFEHIMSGKRYVGCCEGDSVPSKFLPYLMEKQASGEFPLEKVVSRYDIKDFQKAIDDMHSGKALKVVLTWN